MVLEGHAQCMAAVARSFSSTTYLFPLPRSAKIDRNSRETGRKFQYAISINWDYLSLQCTIDQFSLSHGKGRFRSLGNHFYSLSFPPLSVNRDAEEEGELV